MTIREALIEFYRRTGEWDAMPLSERAWIESFDEELARAMAIVERAKIDHAKRRAEMPSVDVSRGIKPTHCYASVRSLAELFDGRLIDEDGPRSFPLLPALTPLGRQLDDFLDCARKFGFSARQAINQLQYIDADSTFALSVSHALELHDLKEERYAHHN